MNVFNNCFIGGRLGGMVGGSDGGGEGGRLRLEEVLRRRVVAVLLQDFFEEEGGTSRLPSVPLPTAAVSMAVSRFSKQVERPASPSAG